MQSTYGFGPLSLRTRGFDALWNFWQWKLDPFGTSPQSGDAEEILFCREEKPVLTEQNQIPVLDEKSGLFRKKIYVSENGCEWWLLESRADETVMLALEYDRMNQTIFVRKDETQTAGFAAFEQAGKILLSFLPDSQVLPLHGCAVETGGKVLIFTGESGVGKTTQARLWRDKRNAFILNSDNACLRMELSPPVFFGIPWSGTGGESVNRSAPAAAVIALKQAEENRAERLSVYDSFRALLPAVQYPPWRKDTADRAVTLLQMLTETVPVISLACTPDADAVRTLEHLLREENIL